MPFTSTLKVSKKACSKNVSESKQSHVEKPDIKNTLELSEEKDNENTLLTTSNCVIRKSQFIWNITYLT